MNNLAITLLHRYERSRSRRDLDRAIELLTSQLKWSRDPATLTNMGTALVQRYDRSKAVGDLRRARRALGDALAATPRESPDRVGRLSNLLLALIRQPQSPRAAGQARRTVEEIRALPADVNPSGLVAAVQTWGVWAAARGDWREAAVAFNRGVGVLEGLVRSQSSTALKEAWIRHATGVAIDAAYAHAKEGDGAAAALSFERGRAVLLREDLRRVHGDAAQRSRPSRICNAPPAQRRWCSWPRANGAAWPSLFAPEALPRLSGCRSSPEAHSPSESSATSTVQRERRVRARLGCRDRRHDEVALAGGHGAAGVPLGSARAVVVAAGGLGLLPLHAAWAPDASAPSRKR